MSWTDKRENNYIQVGFWKALGIFASAILVAVVGTAFSVFGIINSDHFTLVRAIDDIGRLERTKLDIQVYEINQQYIVNELVEIKQLVEKLHN